MSQPEIILKGRLDGRQRNRLKSLLNMMYKPSELAEEVGFSIDQVYRVYVPLGCPHERDERNHIWINGQLFREWFEDVYKKRKLASNEAFCLTCKMSVEMRNPERKKTGDGLVYVLCDCPNCGRRLAKIIDQKKRKPKRDK
ncbi:MAG: hypothetical protein DWQ07_08025 [Chloroflexi bacterium]|nr:MAG: hypothetical protein DWQ07_08025 [Chloroflexota bacterium]MBL1197014.1 hypothetical protein [Chloroflexota bacterium]NOH14309.1 hypothetical protein [Chloroflexota bacterium]